MSVLMPPVTTFAASVFFVTLRFYIILTVKRKKTKNSKHSDSALATVNLTWYIGSGITHAFGADGSDKQPNFSDTDRAGRKIDHAKLTTPYWNLLIFQWSVFGVVRFGVWCGSWASETKSNHWDPQTNWACSVLVIGPIYTPQPHRSWPRTPWVVIQLSTFPVLTQAVRQGSKLVAMTSTQWHEPPWMHRRPSQVCKLTVTTSMWHAKPPQVQMQA